MADGAEIIKDLKAAVLAIEWEISDEGMDALIGQIGPLQQQWAGKKPLLVCLQLIRTLAQYIKKARERAHPETVKLLHSVFCTLETVVSDASVSEKQALGMVRSEVEKYNTLKGEIAKPRSEPTPPPPPAEEPSQGMGGATMRSLMDEKEDKTVDGAFDTMFQGMVGGEVAGPDAQQQEAPVAPAAPAAMPSSSPIQGADDKLVIPDRVDDEVFQEADDLLDDFFADDEESFSFDDEVVVPVAAAEEDETVEVDLGKVSTEEAAPAEVASTAVPDEEPEEVEIGNLEKIIQGLQQGVSDTAVAELTAEVADLHSQYVDHSSLKIFLEIIGSIGRHLAENADVATSQSCGLLQKIFDRLNHALFTMKPKQDILAAHLETIADYGAWHEQVVGEIKETAAAAATPVESAEEPVAARADEMSESMIAEVKQLVRQEVDMLREELLEVMRENM